MTNNNSHERDDSSDEEKEDPHASFATYLGAVGETMSQRESESVDDEQAEKE